MCMYRSWTRGLKLWAKLSDDVMRDIDEHGPEW